MSERPTADLVILIGVVVLAFVIGATCVGIIVQEIIDPERDTSAGADFVSHAVTSIVSVTVGYIAGRHVRSEQ